MTAVRAAPCASPPPLGALCASPPPLGAAPKPFLLRPHALRAARRRRVRTDALRPRVLTRGVPLARQATPSGQVALLNIDADI